MFKHMDSLIVIVIIIIQIKVFSTTSTSCRSGKNVCCVGHLYQCKHLVLCSLLWDHHI